MLSTLTFFWLHHQTFYKRLQSDVLTSIPRATAERQWADVGCSTGLMSRLAQQLGYSVTGYDINASSLVLARLLSSHIVYENKDFTTISETFDVVTATSLLSVMDDKEMALTKLISLLKDEHATLILIEPTDKMTVTNVWGLIENIKSFWYYKGLLLWAKAREGKAVPVTIFKNMNGVSVNHDYYLKGMVRVSYVRHAV